jgi:hypothetical protein
VATEVGSVSAFGATVTFYLLAQDGKTAIGMKETGSAFAKHTVVAPLLAKGLTTQEIYLALAPKGAAVPAALVAAQADEAAQSHRNAEVQLVTVDASQYVEKDLSPCGQEITSSQAPPNTPSLRWPLQYAWQIGSDSPHYGDDINLTYEYPGLYPVRPLGDCRHGYTTTDWVIFGACYLSGEPVAITLGDRTNPSCNYTSFGPAVMVDPNTYTYFFGEWSTGASWWIEADGSTCDYNCSFQEVYGSRIVIP